MIQQDFAQRVLRSVKEEPAIIGLAVAGSWISSEIDEYSDLDLILFTIDKLQGRDKMLSYAEKFGKLLSGFTGEHVGEPRLFICLYDDPLIHVDLKFLTPPEIQTS
jgi:hypothetical protein